MNCNQNYPCTGISYCPPGMGYVPVQAWETPYAPSQALIRGTIFQSLDYPFIMGRCRR